MHGYPRCKREQWVRGDDSPNLDAWIYSNYMEYAWGCLKRRDNEFDFGKQGKKVN